MTQYRTTTDENGDFSLDLPALEKGTYTMKAIFEGDSDAYGSEITKTLIIQGRAYAISIEANNEIIQSGDTTTLTLSFEDEDGDPVIEPGQTIKLYQEYVVSDIILTSDKDILSYADNDVATLTAKVKTSSGGIPIGVDVVFKKDGVLLDTVQTNTQGVATYSYTSTGAGDITFSAECDLVNEIYVEDYWYYNPTEYSSDNVALNIPLPNSLFQIEMDYISLSRTSSSLYIDFGSDTNNRVLFGQLVQDGRNGLIVIKNGTSTDYLLSKLTTINQQHHLKFIYDGTNYIYYNDTDTLSTPSVDIAFDTVFHVEGARNGRLKNIKIKAL